MISARPGDKGFTLIELLVGIVILGIIMVPLATAVLVTFADTATTVRVSESHDRLISGVYWAPDIASTESFRTSSQCAIPGSSALVLGLTWKDDRGVNYVDYALTSAAPRTLRRYKCIDTGGTTQNKVADQVVSATCTPGCSALTSADRTVRLTLTESQGTVVLDGTRRATP